MTDSQRPRSPLPTVPEYWDRLARRIAEDAALPLAAYAAKRDDWYGVLAKSAPWLMAASAAALVVVLLSLPATQSSTAHVWMERSLSPSDGAGELLGAPEPPSVDELMVQFPPHFELDQEANR